MYFNRPKILETDNERCYHQNVREFKYYLLELQRFKIKVVSCELNKMLKHERKRHRQVAGIFQVDMYLYHTYYEKVV